MIDVINIKCIEEGCIKIPTYNYASETERIYCSVHKKENMIDIRSNKRPTSLNSLPKAKRQKKQPNFPYI